MKKYHLLFLLSLSVIVFGLSSCEKNDEMPTYSYAVGTVMKNESNHYYLDLDSHKKLLLTDSTVINYYKVKDGDRILASFYLLEQVTDGYDYIVNMFDLYKILTKPVIELTPEIADSIGDDRAQITKMWIHKDLLNIEFKVKGTGKIQHMVNVVTTNNPTEPEAGYVSLEFRHNLNGDNEFDYYPGIMSFKLGDFAPGTQGIKGIKIRVNTFFEGEKTYKLDYKSKQSPMNGSGKPEKMSTGLLVK